MPIYDGVFSALSLKTAKNKTPLWQQPLLGRTAELPLGQDTGSRLEHTMNHLVNYRLSGPCHWSPDPMVCGSTAVADYSGIGYIPIHMPPTKTGDDRSIALFIYAGVQSSVSGTESHIKYRYGTFGAGDWTTLWADTLSAYTPLGLLRYVIPYTPPASTGASSVGCIEIKVQNLQIIMMSAFHLPLKYCDADQWFCAPGDCGPGKYISDEAHSFKGLVDSVGDGTANLETMERLTRRTYFNQTHFFGSQLLGSEVLGHTNLLGEHAFAPRARNLLGDNAANYAVPLAVIECTGQDAGGDAAAIELQFKSQSSLNTWTYTVQATDAVSTPLFITPWRTGSSSANGIPVYSNADDLIEINGHVVSGGITQNGSLILRAWALFEGSAW